MMGIGQRKCRRFIGSRAVRTTCWSLGLALASLGFVLQPGWALPGQTVSAAEAWIRTNPTLDPAPGERLTINRRASPAQRFTFQASVFPVTGVSPDVDQRVIRTERFTLADPVNELTSQRLDESLRAIYGVEVFDDYRRAERLFSYSKPVSQGGATPNLVLSGEVREGERFAYWQDLAADPSGQVYLARMTVFLKADLPLLKEQLLEPSP